MIVFLSRLTALPLFWMLLAGRALAFETSPLVIETRSGVRHTFTVEIARSQSEQSQGLMLRRELAAHAGMLFDWPKRPVAKMWMKNTLIPLDMLFIDRSGLIVHVAARTEPYSLEIVTAGRRVRAVLELRGGSTDRLGIAVGDRVQHPIFVNSGR